jgi:RecJ-like exonuclease
MPKEDAFFQSFQPAIDLFKRHVEDHNNIRIVTHNDADGLASGGILTVAAIRQGAVFQTSSEKKLNDKLISELAKENSKLIVFSDFSSGYLDVLSESLTQDILIFDHHLPRGEEISNIVHINPMLQGIDGAREIATSGICYIFAKKLSSENSDLAPIALVGALGDQQDKGERKSLIGLNTAIEEEAIRNHQLDKRIGLIFYGYETRPLSKAIAYTTEPFIPGLSGCEGDCAAFLKSIGIELEKENGLRSLADLDSEETRTLYSSLSSHMLKIGCDSEIIHQLLGTIYIFKLEEPSTALRSGREYASLLNACGRMGRPSLGLAICLGDRAEAMAEAMQTLVDYRSSIAQSLDWIQKNKKIEEMENIYAIRAGNNVNDNIIGVVSGILLNQGFLKKVKPIISTALSEEEIIKVSARSVESLLERGLHLGQVMHEAAKKVQGDGGGHDIAAGANIPIEKEEEFLNTVNQILPRYLQNKMNLRTIYK